jgi:glycosyltransferase involved in cell wall biosynthesis
MPTVLHVLPHPGGGAETYLRLLEGLSGYEQQRAVLSRARSPVSGAPSIARRWPVIARQVGQADLVHVHGDAAALLTLPLLGRRPTVWTTHGLHLLRRRSIVSMGVGTVMRRAQVTICTSHAEAAELGAIAPALRDRLVVVPNGVSLPTATDPAERVAIRAELLLEADDVVALFLGQLESRKRPLDAIAAALAARAGGAPIHLLVAGDGPLAGTAGRQAGAGVTLLGFRNDPERLMRAADLFVLPSAREGLSFALLEAMAHGLAVVAADAPGAPEAIGSAGVLVPAGDRPALAAALGGLARDPGRRAQLARAARERVGLEFSVQRSLEGVRSAYERALAMPTG